MKNVLLALILFLLAGFATTNAQIVNNSFENWYLDTFYLAAGQAGSLPADTISFNEPVLWTSSNYLTGLDSLGHQILVTQSNNAYSGSSAIQMVTDSVHVPPGLIHSLPVSTLIIPGFVVSGVFPLGTQTFTSGSVINPASIVGAGQPFTQRLASISGYYNYKPVFNPNTNSNDTCVVWAALRNGRNIVANAIFKSTDSTGGYLPFSANFNYVSCDVPDTLVILISSSAPNVYTFIQGFGGGTLVPGSQLLVDDLTYDTLAASFTFAPFAKNDLFTVYETHTDTLDVLANDTDCSGQQLGVTLISGPHHGTATLLSNNSIQYTPTPSYLGLDSIYYRDTNGSGDTADALCQIFISQNTGIAPLNQLSLKLRPVPATDELNIQFENPGKCFGKIYDLVGNAVIATELNSNNNQVNIQTLPNGIYSIEILNNQNAIIGRSKFVVAR